MRMAVCIRGGIREVVRSPQQLPALIVVLALCVGCLSAAYVVVETLLLRPLPYSSPDQIVRIWNSAAGTGYRNLSARQFAAVIEADALIASAAPYIVVEQWASREAAGERTRLRGTLTTLGLFRVLDAPPSRQALSGLAESVLTATPAVIVSQRLATRGVLHGRPGERLYLDGVAHTVVAVMPSEFWFPDPQADYWLPLLTEETAATASWEAPVIARMAPGVTVDSATAGLRILFSQEPTPVQPGLRQYWRELAAPVLPALRNVQRAVVLLLLLACVNTAWMLTARARAAERRYALMGALGASPRDVVITRLAASLSIGLLSVPLGVAFAWLAVRFVASHAAAHAPRLAEAHVTGTTLIVALLVSLSVVCVASVPALVIAGRASRQNDLLQRLRPAARFTGEIPLMVAQAAVVIALAMQALLLVLSLRAVLAANVGFHRTDSVVLGFSVPDGKPADVISAVETLRTTLRAQNVNAAVTSIHPLSGRDVLINVSLTREDKLQGKAMMTGLRAVTLNYFRLVGVPLVNGRMFAREDEGDRVVIVNETLAHSMFGSTDCAGKTLHVGDADATIVGVVQSIRHRGLFEEPPSEAYVPYRSVHHTSPLSAANAASRFFVVAVDERGTAETIQLVRVAAESELRAARVDGTWHFRDLVVRAAGERPFVMQVVSAISGVALALMAAGCYGMLLHTVTRQARDIAIRSSLGASPLRVACGSLRPAAVVWSLGCALGFLVFALLSRTVEVPIGPASGPPVSAPLVALLASLILLVTLIAASLRPVVMATRVDLVALLRAE